MAPPAFTPDVTREEVAARVGKTIEGLLSGGKDKVAAVNAMAQGALSIVEEGIQRGEVGGVIALGGGVGTWLGTAVMRSLPLGLPKVMVSTLPFQDIRPIHWNEGYRHLSLRCRHPWVEPSSQNDPASCRCLPGRDGEPSSSSITEGVEESDWSHRPGDYNPGADELEKDPGNTGV